MSWLFFALIAPALYNVANYIEKFLIEKRIREPQAIAIFQGIVFLFIGIATLTLKGFPLLPVREMAFILISGIFLEIYLIPYFFALKKEDVSRIVPLFQFIPMFVLIMSYFLLNEKLSQQQIIGFMLLLLGGVALGTKKLGGSILKMRPAFYLMMLSSFLFAVSIIFFKFVAIQIDLWTTIGYQFLGVGIGTCLILLIPSFRQKFTYEVPRLKFQSATLLAASGLVVILAQLALSIAYAAVPVALASVVSGSIQPLLIFVYGTVLTIWFPKIVKEDLSQKTVITKLLAILVIIIGIVLVQV